MTLRTTITLALLAACTGPAIDMSAEPLTIDPEDGGAPTAGVMTLASGEHIYGDTTQSPFPVNLMEWEVENHGVFRLGGHRGLGYLPLRHLRLNADEMIEFQLDGSIAMKLQDHPTGRLLHFTEVADVWFGNTLETDALLGYQGGNGPTTAQGPGRLPT